MEQDLNANCKQLEEVLKNKLSEKVKKGISGKIDQVNNSVNILSQQTMGKAINDEQMKQLMNHLSLISKNLQEIFQKEIISEDPKKNQTFIDKLDGFQIAGETFSGFERQPFVTKHNDILVDLNQEANQYLQNKINLPLNDKTGENFLNLFYRSNKLYNSSIDNLLDGIKKKTDLKTIITQRMTLEDNYSRQIMDQQLMQEEEEIQDQQLNYIQNDDNNNMNMQDQYNQDECMNMNQNDDDDQMLQNDNQLDEEDDDEHI
ncbi:hypothetical protein TTHERM_00752180 (macronuclear) [Tetrahymena thermophila SB210]|uniref:Uncharacterized protein n=1 Tax=Tetrahymena thermophila (strain SB210) TaxID=312017 RepID=Q23NK2_TETTS|nr:hypothetical protein TTHERM_00752180 [Tetrahymena thermophila SB210]EAR98072.1 hypothetical protein TTHERM_00752180 [Tetrahymena thermophila SB210]|eukprot:XP_001018317.1 hypothetical protein TTHERM_00752180 [Tetrahymena thermophila SB210]